MKVSVILSTLAAATLVSAGKFHQVLSGKTNNIIPNGYIIEYESHITHDLAHQALKGHKVEYKVRNEYNIFNGASITVDSEHDGHAIASISGVKNVWLISTYTIPKIQKSKTKPTDPQAISDHIMTGVKDLHEKYKLTGKGVKIGVIDTGVDYKHPAFSAAGANAGCFARYGKNCRITHGWDFVGDDYTGLNTPVPDSDPMDCYGHGTHVAGIIGGNALNIKVSPKPPQPFVGVAPDVTFGAYRIFGCNGSSGDDVILAAMELAFNDGMDVINMSLGGGSSYKENPTAVLAEKLIVRGMALAGAAGNAGDSGVWMVSDTGLGDHATSVASFDNLFLYYDTLSYGGGTFPYTFSDGYGHRIGLDALPIVPLLSNGSLSDGCDQSTYDGQDVKGKIVLALGDITRCKSGGRGALASANNAAAMIIQSTYDVIDAIAGIPDFPMASISQVDGNTIIASWKANAKNTVTWSKTQTLYPGPNGGAPSDFSSFGLDGDLRSKPDIGAPGGNILSTYPLAKGGYIVMSGTSMATPYVAGSHALYMQSKKAKPHGDVIRKVFKNTATLTSNYKGKTKASVAKQGAGLINVLRAVLTTTSITPDHIDLLDTVNFKKNVKIVLKNEGKHTETYTFSHVPADALRSYNSSYQYPFSTPVIEADYATVKFSSGQIKLKASQSAIVTLSFKEPKKGCASDWPMYSGWVVATPKSKGGVAVSVPYIGVKGDIRNVPMMDTTLGFPFLNLANAT
ncbi:hypothetical protein BGZ76_003668, partial [Entomortierella beljakovae]